jgi:hypothetical protein
MSFLALAGIFFVAGLVLEKVTSWIAVRVTRKRHPELWVHSGHPTLLGNGDLMKAWPLVRYYRDRNYLIPVQLDDQHLPPVSDPEALKFAERLRTPLLYGYWAGWAGILVAIAFFVAEIIRNN